MQGTGRPEEGGGLGHGHHPHAGGGELGRHLQVERAVPRHQHPRPRGHQVGAQQRLGRARRHHAGQRPPGERSTALERAGGEDKRPAAKDVAARPRDGVQLPGAELAPYPGAVEDLDTETPRLPASTRGRPGTAHRGRVRRGRANRSVASSTARRPRPARRPPGPGRRLRWRPPPPAAPQGRPRQRARRSPALPRAARRGWPGGRRTGRPGEPAGCARRRGRALPVPCRPAGRPPRRPVRHIRCRPPCRRTRHAPPSSPCAGTRSGPPAISAAARLSPRRAGTGRPSKSMVVSSGPAEMPGLLTRTVPSSSPHRCSRGQP